MRPRCLISTRKARGPGVLCQPGRHAAPMSYLNPGGMRFRCLLSYRLNPRDTRPQYLISTGRHEAQISSLNQGGMRRTGILLQPGRLEGTVSYFNPGGVRPRHLFQPVKHEAKCHLNPRGMKSRCLITIREAGGSGVLFELEIRNDRSGRECNV